MGGLTRWRYMNKGPVIIILLGIIVLGAAAMFLLNPSTQAAAPDRTQHTERTSKSPVLSAETRGALSDVIQAQGFNCPIVSDGMPTGEDQRGQVVQVRCENDLQFKVTLRSKAGMPFLVAPWE